MDNNNNVANDNDFLTYQFRCGSAIYIRTALVFSRYHKIDDKLTGWKTKVEESQA